MLYIQDLKLLAQGRALLSRLDWRIAPGECWSVIGKNGAGKTTLLKTLSGLRPPDGGSVFLDGRAVMDWPLLELAQKRAFLSQAQSDAFGYRAIETVLAARHPYHAHRWWESDSDRRAAYAAMQDMDVAELATRDVRTLSGGERQRVAIAALLAQDAPLMLLDEPATALDLAHQVRLMELLARLCRERGKTLVMALHDLNLAQGVATHALLLDGDGGWQAGPVKETMTPELLSACLGHPVEAVRHGERDIFVAVQ
jgi:iron complex transport system ATP-binding protein